MSAEGIDKMAFEAAEATYCQAEENKAVVDIESEFRVIIDIKRALYEDTKLITELIMDLEKKREAISEPYETAIQEHEDYIKTAVLNQCKSFKCDYGKATFRKGSRIVKWNDDALLGYAIEHPEIEQFRQENEGKPSVSISISLDGGKK